MDASRENLATIEHGLRSEKQPSDPAQGLHRRGEKLRRKRIAVLHFEEESD